MAVAEMARKKSAAGKKPSQAPLREELITMRCTSAFKGWLDGVSDREERTTAVVIERALKVYAEKHGYDAPPPR